MAVQFEQLKDRAKAWLLPIAGAPADPAAAKLEPAYQAIAAEVARLDRPDGGEVDWKKVSTLAEELLQSRTKDLLLGAYLAHALHRLRGIDGLATGATLLAELIDQFWDTLQPDLRRLRARVNALQWFLEKTALILPEKDYDPSELPRIEALAAAVVQLRDVVRVRFAASAPALSPLLERIERMRATATPPEPQPAAAEPAPLEARAEAPPAPAPPAALADPGDATDFLRGLGDSLLSAAALLRRRDPASPDSYRLLRTGLWLHISAPPTSSAGRTQVPPPSALGQLATLAKNARWAELLEESESAAPQARFALDLQRSSWQALQGLGPAYDRARAALGAELRSLLARLPQLTALSFADGTPFASPEKRAWIAAELEPATSAPGPARPQAGGDAERSAQIRRLFSESQAAPALALLQQAVHGARDGRDRFLARLDLARTAAGAGLAAVAKATYDELDREALAHGLDAWEPELACQCLRGLIAAARALPEDPRGARADLAGSFQRLCRLDPAAAHEVWP